MLSRLIVPVGRLEEFERRSLDLLPVSSDPASDDCWVISALTAAVDHEDFESHLAQIEAFNERHLPSGSGAVVIDTIECRTPDGRTVFGIGTDSDVATASVKAILSAANGIAVRG